MFYEDKEMRHKTSASDAKIAAESHWWRIRGIVKWRDQVCNLDDATPKPFKETRCETKEDALDTFAQWHNEFTEHGYIPMGGSFNEGYVGYIHESGKFIVIWIYKINN